jgi:thioredoxin-related protein
MLSRRSLLSAAALAMSTVAARSAPVLSDDGLYIQPWFLESLLELGDDLTGATERRKRFAIVWELKGCPYCKDIHLINFAKPEIESYVKERFDILQLNIIGSREVVDFDGEKLPEKRLAEKYGVRFTPTFQFFPESIDGLAKKKPRDREIVRSQGYLKPEPFLATFQFVAERAYEKGTLADFLKRAS